MCPRVSPSLIFFLWLSLALCARLTATSVTNASELETAIVNANAGTVTSIEFANDISAAQFFRPLNSQGNFTAAGQTYTINGNGFTLSQDGIHRGFFIGASGASAGTITIQNLTIANANAKGGDGGNGFVETTGAGGAGAGLGGALYVADGYHAILNNVTIISCKASGGNGGHINSAPGTKLGGGGGGGGLGANGGSGGTDPTVETGGGGGGSAFTGDGGDGGFFGGEARGGGGGGVGLPGQDGNAGGNGGGDFDGNGGGHGATPPSSGGGGQATASGGIAGGFGGGGAAGGGSLFGAGSGGMFAGGGGSGFPESVAGNGGIGGGGGGAQNSGGNGGFAGGGGGTGGYGLFPPMSGGQGGFGGGKGGDVLVASGISGGGGGGAMGGAIFVQSGGTLEIQGPISFSGNTLQAGSGGAGASGGESGANGSTYGTDIFLMSGGTLIFDISSDVSIANPIESDQGAGGGSGGGLTKNGSATLTLNGTNTYTGTTTLNAGTLFVNGSIITAVNVNGGTFGGNATITGDVTNSGGTLSPGTSIGTINITGNYTQGAGGTLVLEINANGTSDLLNITGNANVGGTLLISPQAGTYSGTTNYNILKAASITGNFTTISFTTTSPDIFKGAAFPTASVTISPDPTIILSVNAPPSLSTVGSGCNNANAQSVANYIDNLPIPCPSSLCTSVNTLRSQSCTNVNNGLNQTAPAQNKSSSTLSVQETITTVSSGVRQRTYTAVQSPKKEAGTKKGWGGNSTGSAGQGPVSDPTVGYTTLYLIGTLGVDHMVHSEVMIGTSVAYIYGKTDDGSDYGKTDTNSINLSAYATWMCEQAYVGGVLSGEYDLYHNVRHMPILQQTAIGDYGGWEGLININGGYTFTLFEGLKIAPYASFDFQYLFQAPYTEHGAGSLDLVVQSTQVGTWRDEIGVHLFFNHRRKMGTLMFQSKTSFMREDRFLNNTVVSRLKIYPDQGHFITSLFLPNRNLLVTGLNASYTSHDGKIGASAGIENKMGNHYSTLSILLQATLQF